MHFSPMYSTPWGRVPGLARRGRGVPARICALRRVECGLWSRICRRDPRTTVDGALDREVACVARAGMALYCGLLGHEMWLMKLL